MSSTAAASSPNVVHWTGAPHAGLRPYRLSTLPVFTGMSTSDSWAVLLEPDGGVSRADDRDPRVGKCGHRLRGARLDPLLVHGCVSCDRHRQRRLPWHRVGDVDRVRVV